MRDQKRRMLVWLAETFAAMGLHEEGGNNRGPTVSFFQKLVDGRSVGEPWCLCFALGSVLLVDKAFNEIHQQTLLDQTQLQKTEHCMTLWRSSERQRVRVPLPGCLAIWNKRGTEQGHAGIVLGYDLANEMFSSAEGNTRAGPGIERDGDTVKITPRSLVGFGNMQLMGFIDPWKE